MTKNPRFQPRLRTVLVVLFPGFQILDATGPIAAFEIASRFGAGGYRIKLAATIAGAVRSSSGVALEADRLPRRLSGIDTVLLAGGDGARAAFADEILRGFLKRACQAAPRAASVCSGSLLLAHAGLLDGRRATTHWSRARTMQRLFPAVRVEPDKIWVRDGKFWTSAGITAGIDLALAMIAEDLGPAIARDTARQLVVYAQRPGGQTQHSNLIELDGLRGRFAALHAWMRERLDQDLRVERLAEKMAMSTRTFARVYAAETGLTPAKAVERLRIEAARAAIESGAPSLPQVAHRTGFGDEERMRRAFIRTFGAPPSALRRNARAGAQL
jgi:transcriptional regulator GlxA family with amidase domain